MTVSDPSLLGNMALCMPLWLLLLGAKASIFPNRS